MSELKTKPTDVDVYEFIRSFANTEQKQKDSLELLRLLEDFTSYKPKMWGASIIGFGSYHYKSDRCKQEGDWPLVGFSPRKAAISLYIYAGAEGQERMLQDLGKFKMGKACIYVKRLSDIDLDILKEMVETTIEYINSKYSSDVHKN